MKNMHARAQGDLLGLRNKCYKTPTATATFQPKPAGRKQNFLLTFLIHMEDALATSTRAESSEPFFSCSCGTDEQTANKAGGVGRSGLVQKLKHEVGSTWPSWRH